MRPALAVSFAVAQAPAMSRLPSLHTNRPLNAEAGGRGPRFRIAGPAQVLVALVPEIGDQRVDRRVNKGNGY